MSEFNAVAVAAVIADNPALEVTLTSLLTKAQEKAVRSAVQTIVTEREAAAKREAMAKAGTILARQTSDTSDDQTLLDALSLVADLMSESCDHKGSEGSWQGMVLRGIPTAYGSLKVTLTTANGSRS